MYFSKYLYFLERFLILSMRDYEMIYFWAKYTVTLSDYMVLEFLKIRTHIKFFRIITFVLLAYGNRKKDYSPWNNTIGDGDQENNDTNQITGTISDHWVPIEIEDCRSSKSTYCYYQSNVEYCRSNDSTNSNIILKRKVEFDSPQN